MCTLGNFSVDSYKRFLWFTIHLSMAFSWPPPTSPLIFTTSNSSKLVSYICKQIQIYWPAFCLATSKFLTRSSVSSSGIMSVTAVSAKDTGRRQTSRPCCISMLCNSLVAGRNFRHPSGRLLVSPILTTNDRRLTRKARTVMPSCELEATVGTKLPDSSTQYDLPSISCTIHRHNALYHSWAFAQTHRCCV